MPVSVEWYDDEKNIAIYYLKDYWAINELSEKLEEQLTMGENQPIYYIVDMSRANHFPNGILSRQNDYTRFLKLEEGLTVLVKAPTLANIAIKILVRLGVKFHSFAFADSIEEAAMVIRRHQETQATLIEDSGNTSI